MQSLHDVLPSSRRLEALLLSSFVFDRIPQYANSLDLDFACVAGFHPYRLGLACMTNTGRRAGENDITGLQRHAFGEINERFGKREHHVVGVVGLHGLAIES